MPSAVVMAVGTLIVVLGALYATLAVDALNKQASDLDPSERRAGGAFGLAAWAGVLGAVGLVVFVAGWIAYGVSSVRGRRARSPRASAPTTTAAVAGLVLVLALLWVVASPGGPLAKGIGLAAGNGAGGATQVQVFEGELQAATIGGQATAEDTHAFKPSASTGAIRLRMGSGNGLAVPAYAVAILEAPDGSGWKEVARTKPAAETTVDVPTQTYAGALRIRVQLQDNAAGNVKYVLGVSFTPA